MTEIDQTLMLFSADGGDTWRLAKDEAAYELLDDPDLDTMFVDDEDEIIAKLNATDPTRPLGTTIFESGDIARSEEEIEADRVASGRDDTWGIPKTHRGFVRMRTPRMEGGDSVDKILAHVLEHGETVWEPTQIIERVTEWEGTKWEREVDKPNGCVWHGDEQVNIKDPAFRDRLNALGFVVANANGNPDRLRIRHSPKAAKSAQKRKNTTATTYTNLKPMVVAIINALPGEVRNCVTTSPIGGAATLINDQLRKAIEMMNAIKGKNAHRKVKGFQELLAVWGTNAENNRRKYRKAQGGKLAGFVTWMDGELKARKPPKREQVDEFTLGRERAW